MSTLIEQMLKNATPQEKLQIAKTVRKLYVRAIGDTKEKIDPARLRKLDADIALIEKHIN